MPKLHCIDYDHHCRDHHTIITMCDFSTSALPNNVSAFYRNIAWWCYSSLSAFSTSFHDSVTIIPIIIIKRMTIWYAGLLLTYCMIMMPHSIVIIVLSVIIISTVVMIERYNGNRILAAAGSVLSSFLARLILSFRNMNNMFRWLLRLHKSVLQIKSKSSLPIESSVQQTSRRDALIPTPITIFY